MPYSHTTAFGTTQGNLTDDERLRASQGMNQAQIAAQMAALQAEINDRQAGRVFQGGQAGLDRTQQSTMFDKNAALQTGLDQSATQRALGVTGLQMGPANAEAALNLKKWDAGAPEREAVKSMFRELGVNTDGTTAQAGAPGSPVSVSMQPGGSTAGPMVDPDTKWQHNIAMLAALKGGQMPDFQGMAMQHQIAQMAIDEAKRKTATDAALAARNAGDPAKAKALADAGGVSLPRLSPVDYATAHPAILDGIKQVAGLGKTKQVDKIAGAFADLTKQMTAEGVDQKDAEAYLRQQLEPLLAKAGVNWGDFADTVIGGKFGDRMRTASLQQQARRAVGLTE